LIIGILVGVANSIFLNLKERSVIESMSYTITSGIKFAIENSINKIYLNKDDNFKLKDILQINEKELISGLKWSYTTNGSYNKDGTYSLRDET